jgi:hypothetical protein
MTEDEIRKKVFEGVVPVRFVAAFIDVPLCFNAPRCLSLGAFAYRALDHFLGPETRDLWFAHGDRPLKWHLPLGVLYDALAPDLSAFHPLTIAVRTDAFPECALRCDSPAAASAHFQHAFKQSLQLTDGNQELITHHTGLHQQLERALLDGDFAAFAELARLRRDGIARWRQWPVRVVRRDLTVVQAFVEAGEHALTLRDALAARGIDAAAPVVHGIALDPALPLRDAADLFLNPDGFVYVVVN